MVDPRKGSRSVGSLFSLGRRRRRRSESKVRCPSVGFGFSFAFVFKRWGRESGVNLKTPVAANVPRLSCYCTNVLNNPKSLRALQVAPSLPDIFKLELELYK